MQKLIISPLILMAFLVTNTANTAELAAAFEDKKLATIQAMYEQDISNEGMDYPVVLQQYANQNLQAAMQLEQDYFDKQQMSCHIGHDVLWDSQDPDYTQQKQFSMTDAGWVQVSLAQGSLVYYDLTCEDTHCAVADVVLEDGRSFKNYLLENCR